MTNEGLLWLHHADLEEILTGYFAPEPTMPNIPLMPLAEEFKMRRDLESWRRLAICLGAAAVLLIVEAMLR